MSQPVALAPSSSIQSRAVRLFAPLNRLWARIWFQERDTTPLEIIRIGLGAAMLLHYAFATPHVLTFWGDDGWMPRIGARREHGRSLGAVGDVLLLGARGIGSPSTHCSCFAARP